MIVGLLLFNAVVGFLQEGRAQHTLKALKSRLALTASVRRDGSWAIRPATDLVPGDVIKLSLGGVVAADARLTAGDVLLDQSMLTGELGRSRPGRACRLLPARWCGAERRWRRLPRLAREPNSGRRPNSSAPADVVSSQQKAVMRVVRNLVGFAGCVIVALAVYAIILRLPAAAIVSLVLTAVLGSIPVALPATFTFAAAIGARALAKFGVLPTRLSAVDEAGTMDVLCVDKTGTLTENALMVANVHPMEGFDAGHVLTLAALASSDGGQDPVDEAIRAAAGKPGRRSAAPGRIRTLRSGHQNVGSDGVDELGRRRATRGQGRVCPGHWPRPAATVRGGGGKRA